MGGWSPNCIFGILGCSVASPAPNFGVEPHYHLTSHETRVALHDAVDKTHLAILRFLFCQELISLLPSCRFLRTRNNHTDIFSSSIGGKGGKGLGKGGAKRHRKILRDNIQGITKPAIRRLARRGGVKRISASKSHPLSTDAAPCCVFARHQTLT